MQWMSTSAFGEGMECEALLKKPSHWVLPTMFVGCGMEFSLQYELGKKFEKYSGRP